MNGYTRWLLFVGALAVTALAGAGEPVRGLSKPSSDLTLSFVRPGKIASIPVKEGDQVKVGQLLVEQDDLAEREQLAQLKAQADDQIRIDAAQAQLDQKKVDLKKLEAAAKFNAATKLEVEHAVLDVTIAALSVDLARFEKEQAVRKYREMSQQVERMRILSPINGRIEHLHKRPGESVDALDPVLRVVNTETLWVEAAVDLETVCPLEYGQQAELEFRFPGQSESQPPKTTRGTIIFIGDVADGASNTRLVRVEIKNVFKRPAGEHVLVRFCPPAQAAAATTQPAKTRKAS